MISVIIPVYNKLDNLKAVLNCLKMQTINDFEVIISDDGSTENIIEGIKAVIKDAKFKIKYVWQSDLGFRAGQARNNGVKVASGNKLLFLDQDIIFDVNFIKKIKKLSDENNRTIIYRTILTTVEEKEKIFFDIEKNSFSFSNYFKLITSNKKYGFYKSIVRDKIKILKFNLGLRKMGPSTLGIFLIPKEVYIKINGFDEEFSGYGYEDVEFSFRIYLNNFKSSITFLRTLHLYHEHMSIKDKDKMELNEKLVKEKKKQGNKRAFYGLDNRKDKDEIIFKELN